MTGKVVLNTTFTSTLSWQLYSHCGVTWDVTWTSYVKSHTATRVICEVNKFNWVKRLSYSWTTFTTSAFKIWEKSRSHFSKICQYFCWKNWYLMSNVGVTKINPHIELYCKWKKNPTECCIVFNNDKPYKIKRTKTKIPWWRCVINRVLLWQKAKHSTYLKWSELSAVWLITEQVGLEWRDALAILNRQVTLIF